MLTCLSRILVLVTAEPEVNMGSSRRGPIMTLSETPSKEQHENGTTFGHERPTDSDCCLICTCLSVRNFENAINNSYTHVQPHCIFFFFQCRTGVVADCFKFCGTRHGHSQKLLLKNSTRMEPPTRHHS
jgi:hypothetical protein